MTKTQAAQRLQCLIHSNDKCMTPEARRARRQALNEALAIVCEIDEVDAAELVY